MTEPWRGRRSAAVEPRGQALVEFALVFPVLILLVFGVIDLGRAIYTYNTVANAARNGVRVATVNQILTSPDCDQSRPVEDPLNAHWSIKTCAANSATSLGVQPSDVDVSFSVPAGNTLLTCSPTLHVGCIAAVTVRSTYRPLTPIIGNLVGAIAMSSTSTQPIERVFP